MWRRGGSGYRNVTLRWFGRAGGRLDDGELNDHRGWQGGEVRSVKKVFCWQHTALEAIGCGDE
jgi:hypothetical protein